MIKISIIISSSKSSSNNNNNKKCRALYFKMVTAKLEACMLAVDLSLLPPS